MYSQRHVPVILRRLQNIGPSKRNFSWAHAGKFRLNRRQINQSWNQSVRVLARVCTRQFEFIIAQRVQRTIQIFHLYTRIWNETALREFIRTWNRRIWLTRCRFLFASVFVTSYDWEKERISDQEMYSFRNDIKRIYKLKDTTVVCSKCHLRLVIDVVQPEVAYCKCDDCKATNTSDEWEPFLERQDMLVWRKLEMDKGGLYSYKVYGSFADVSAEDFLQVQIDVDYRKEWDHTAKELNVLESDPTNNDQGNGNCEIIYWEMIWPKLFANRDYVYQRRWIQDKEKGVIIIISKVTEHPNAPVRPDTHRVSSYWSYMVIKPYREFSEAGIEFGLTYFDDPGINIPSAITSWVAMRGFPDYLCKMREASKQYKNYKLTKEHTAVIPKSIDEQNRNDEEQPVLIQDDINVSISIKQNSNNVNEEHNSDTDENLENDYIDETTDESEKDKTESSDAITEKSQGFFSYFFITRLFA